MSELMKYVNNMFKGKELTKREKAVWQPPTEVDLFRVCAVADKLYMSRYVFVDGVWQYGGPVVPEAELRFSLYSNKSPVTLSSRDMEEEKCPHCGTRGRIVECFGCGALVCRGRTTAAGYFRCRISCGKAGQIVKAHVTNNGIAL